MINAQQAGRMQRSHMNSLFCCHTACSTICLTAASSDSVLPASPPEADFTTPVVHCDLFATEHIPPVRHTCRLHRQSAPRGPIRTAAAPYALAPG